MIVGPGARIGPYEIVGSLGAGGMGEVYRARDPKLHRDVAIKVLPPAFAQDADRRARFEREARILASLNHPRIATVHGLEEAGGVYALVMELVEGPTLNALLTERRLTLSEVLDLAAQMADALEAAHEQGVIHRDLKPANIKVRPDGSVKVLDFGLAKALAQSTDSAIDLTNSPTMMPTGRTEAGIILGTAAYMSPEQARGRPVDKRADIWAFGCVLYEMLTGQPPFAGESTTDILAEVVQRDPDWAALPADVPASIRALLRRTLQKNARERLRDIGDARLELAAIAASGGHADSRLSGVAAPAPTAAPGRRMSWLGAAGWFAMGALVAAAALQFGPTRRADPLPSPASVRTVVTLPPQTSIAAGRGSSIALSPDGRTLVFAGQIDKTVRLFVRPLDKFEAVPLAGTEDAAHPFFSPDGRWIGFFAGGKLKKIAVEGGGVVTLADARTPRGEAWLADDSILVTPFNNVGLSRVPAIGGAPDVFTRLETGEMSHRWPRAVPGGAAVLFSVWNDTGWEPSRIAVQPLNETTHRVLLEGGGFPRVLQDPASGRGYLIYARTEGLLAAPLDLSRLEITGPPVPLVDNVLANLSGGAQFDAAAGTLAYVSGTSSEGDRDLVWVTLDGQATPARRVQQMGRYFSVSPDATRILRNNTVGVRDVWIEDLVRGTSTRVTNSAENFFSIWSPDSTWIVISRGQPVRNLYRRGLGAGAVDERLTTSANSQEPWVITPDGRTLVYMEIDPVSSRDIWLLDLPPVGTGGASAPAPRARPFVKTNFSEDVPALSPDARWLAYQSNESGRFEVYVRSFPDAGPAHQVSTDGGLFPQWSRDGNLFYRSTTATMMTVPVDAKTGLTSGPPRPLFDASRYENLYGITPDGKRLLMMTLTNTEQAPTTVSIVQNLIAELRQRVK
jgi:eukaryotic-like serine/threonine-protein kinase